MGAERTHSLERTKRKTKPNLLPWFPPPLSGHAILCKQGRGEGGTPRTYVSVVTVSSVGGKAEDKNIQILKFCNALRLEQHARSINLLPRSRG